MADDLEELAAKGRAKKARQRADAKRQQATRKAPRRSPTNTVLNRSLTGRASWLLVGAVLLANFGTLGLAMVVSAGLAGLVNPALGGVCTAVTLFGGIAMTTVAFVGLARWRRSEADRWLQRLPFAFDIDGYHKALSGKRRTTVATVHVVFLDPLDPEQQVTVAAAVEGAADVQNTEWAPEGQELRIRSRRLDTYVITKAKGKDNYHSNAAVHDWFRQLADQGLVVVNRRHPFETVQLKAE